MKHNQLRKFVVGLGAFGAVICLFWIYMQVTDTVPIIAPDQSSQGDLQIPESMDDVRQNGGSTFIRSTNSRFVDFDPVTHETRRVFGFEKLLNPDKQSTRRQVTDPYIEFYDARYFCRVNADTGIFQMELAGENSTPEEAQLDGHVVIRMTPKSESKISETVIYLDDLVFSSERSEFATDGPVKIVSEKMTLDGQGLILIFDTEKGRVEFMRIRDLETLLIKDGLASKYTNGPEDPTKSNQPKPTETVSNKNGSDVDASSDYFQCTLEDNVCIEYGNELVVSGAQRVNIQNILFSDKQSDSTENTQPQSESVNPNLKPSEDLAEVAVQDGSKDVIVRCDGGIVLQPMQQRMQNLTDGALTELSVEMSGTPLRIDRVTPENQDKTEPLVYCGLLEYRPQQDILRLFTDPAQPQIVLEAQRSRSRIQTQGNVFWDRRNQYANIAGPGTIYLSGSDPAVDPSEIMFDGMMDLLFAQPQDQVSEPVIRSINFSGGINGILKENGGYKTRADSARLDFGLENVLSKARLLGGVLLEAVDSDKIQKAVADSATFHFEENKVKTADLTGAASFQSDQGNLRSDNIEIAFEENPDGDSTPVRIKATGNSILETAKSQSVKTPAKFEAKRIDYDLLSGSGVAMGPIRFTFYQQNKKQTMMNAASEVPIVVTADENAEFIADGSRNIKEIVFNQNVLVTRKSRASVIEQTDTLHGDKLTVSLGVQSDIERITMSEGRVSAESKRLQDSEQVFNSKIYCNSMIFDQTANEILIQGPGRIEAVNTPLETDNPLSTQQGLDRSFVCMIKGFQSIHWFLNDRHLLAKEQSNAMEISYFPLIGNAVQKQNFLYSRQLEANYSDEPFALTRIYTSQGVNYEQYTDDRSQRLHQVIGQTLSYNADNDRRWLTVEGSEEKPCYADGWRTDQAYIDLDTGEVKTTLSTTPGVIRGF